ncbi:MAG: hypothetical protein Q4C22_06870, partial [Bacillota bacterium]|nr:hypothetical protein [Bacillota bacterium]
MMRGKREREMTAYGTRTGLRKMVAFVLILCMALTMTPGLGSMGPAEAHATGSWTVTYDSSVYDPDNLWVEIYAPAEAGGLVINWTTEAGILMADKSAAELFREGQDYYLVVQQLEKADFRSECVRYMAAMQGAALREEWAELPDGPLDDEDDKTDFTDAEDYVQAKVSASVALMDDAAIEALLKGYADSGQPWLDGYTPGDLTSKVKASAHKLTAAEKSGGFAISNTYLDACYPVTVTNPAVSFETVDRTAMEVADGGNYIFFNDGDTCIPTLIDWTQKNPEETEDASWAGDDTTETNEATTGKMLPGYQYMLPAGSYTVAYADGSSNLSQACLDWETITVGANGGSCDFSGDRSYVTVSVTVSAVLGSDKLGIVMLSMPLGGAGGVSANLLKGSSLLGTPELRTAKIKPGNYEFLGIGVVEMDYVMDGVQISDADQSSSLSYFLRDHNANLTSGKSYAIGNVNSTEWTAALEFSDASGNSGPFAPGTPVYGNLCLKDEAGLELLAVSGYAATLSQQAEGTGSIAMLRTQAAYADGTMITAGSDGVFGTRFPVTAPAESKTVNATAAAILTVDGVEKVNLSRSAAGTLPVTAAQDSTPPAVPAGFSGSVSGTAIEFSWTEVTDADLEGYRIYRTDSTGATQGTALRTIAATAESQVTTASVTVDSAAWGAGPWYFAASAYDGSGNESAGSSLATVQDPASLFFGTGAATPKTGGLANGVYTLTAENAGAFTASFTADSGIAEVDLATSMSAVLHYTDITGTALTTAVSLTKSERVYSADFSIAPEMASLGTVVFLYDDAAGTAREAGSASLNCDIRANITVSVPAAAEYGLSGSFDKARLTAGDDAVTELTTKTGNTFSGQYLRKDYPGASLSFLAGEEVFTPTGEQAGYRTGDDFAVPAADMPEKIRLDVSYAPETCRVNVFVDFIDNTGGKTTVNFARIASGAALYVEKPAGAQNVEKIQVRMTPVHSEMEASGSAALFTEGEAYKKGAVYTAAARLHAKGLSKYMYLDVFCGENGDQLPKANLQLTFTDGSESVTGVWHYLTGQVDTSALTPGDVYTVSYINGDNAFAGSAPVTVPASVPETREAQGSVPVLKLYDKISVNLTVGSRMSEEDWEAEKRGNSLVKQEITPDVEVFYRSMAGAWECLPGSGAATLTYGAGEGLEDFDCILKFSGEPVLRKDVDLDAGLRIEFGENAQLYQPMGSGLQLPVAYRTAKLAAGQSLETKNPAGALTVNLRETRTLSGGGTYGTSYFDAAQALTWAFSGTIGNLDIGGLPAAEVTANRSVGAAQAYFLFKSTDGTLIKRYCEAFSAAVSGGQQRFAFADLPYGTYDILFYLGEGPRGQQLEEQFLQDSGCGIPSDVSAQIVSGVSITADDSTVSLYTPAAAVDLQSSGIQGVTVTPDKGTVLAGDLLTYTVRFTCVSGSALPDAQRQISVEGASGLNLEGGSVSIRDEAGNAVPAALTENGGAYSLTVPANSSTLTGVVLISGEVGAGTEAKLTATVGSERYYGVSQITAFSHNLSTKTAKKTIAVSGRGTANGTVKAVITSLADASNTTTQTFTASMYGYWDTELTLPVTVREGTE